MSAVNTEASGALDSQRIDGFAAGVPLTISRPAITPALLAMLGHTVTTSDTLTSGAFVMHAPWETDAAAHIDADRANAGALTGGAWGVTFALDAAASALTATPHEFTVFLTFATAGVVRLESGTIRGRPVPMLGA